MLIFTNSEQETCLSLLYEQLKMPRTRPRPTYCMQEIYFRPLCPHHQWEIEDLDDYSFYHTYFNHVWANLRRNQTLG